VCPSQSVGTPRWPGNSNRVLSQVQSVSGHLAWWDTQRGGEGSSPDNIYVLSENPLEGPAFASMEIFRRFRD